MGATCNDYLFGTLIFCLVEIAKSFCDRGRVRLAYNTSKNSPMEIMTTKTTVRHWALMMGK
jgi:hypothetical protein